MKKDKELDQSGLQWTEQFKAEMNKLDDEERYPVPLPDLPSIELLVTRHKQELRRKLIRDLLLFWSSAMVILGILAAVAYQKPVLILWLQAPILMAGILALLGTSAKQKLNQKRKQQRKGVGGL